MLLKAPLAFDDLERLDLGIGRSAHRVRVGLPSGGRLLFAVTHLHHPTEARAERLAQVEALIDWLATAPEHEAMVVVGDFNASPGEPAYARMGAAGFRSAHRERWATEPPVTWPSGLQAPAMDTDGDPECLDYIWLRGAVEVDDVALAFHRADVEDPTLYPSDHFGLAARIRVAGVA
jgi:endonuclease/exonuclease/phosphatase family metal-dependent hydrolase